MAVELEALKNYLRIDEDITEDDSLLVSLSNAAVKYLEQQTGRAFVDGDDLYSLAVTMLVSHWYENRSAFTTKTNVNELPNHLQSIITHISLANVYPALGGDTDD